MANIKFSDFTVGNTEGDIDFVVGYKGANNIQISPTNLLASALGNYLPLAGGTMVAGSAVLFPDNSFLRFGSGADATIYHDGLDAYFKNFTGKLIIQNNTNDNDVVFQSDDGAGGVATYFYLDGSDLMTRVDKRLRMSDAVSFQLGSNGNFEMYHLNGNTTMDNFTGNLTIRNSANDKDISFACDDGSGGNATYFFLDGSLASGGSLFTRFPDNSNIGFGDSNDLRIYHNGTNSNIENFTGHLQIIQNADDGDIVFRSDNGSGGTAIYFAIDGGVTRTVAYKNFNFRDDVKLEMGTGADFQLYHDSANSIIKNDVGNIIIRNDANDKDIEFASDDGSGGVAVYFYLDGSAVNGSTITGATVFPDKSKIYMGTSGDFEMYHDGTDTWLDNFTGDLNIRNQQNSGDILFRCDNGNGGVATYFQLDGGNTNVKFSKDLYLLDSVKARIGTGSDLQIYHNGSNSYIENFNNDLIISNTADNKDIRFFCDDGSGGTTEYFKLDGSVASGGSVFTRFPDNSNLGFGNSDDLTILHDSNHSYIKNYTGDLYIENFADDKNIIFKCDDGSGGVTEYFRLDGNLGYTVASRNILLDDNVKLRIGSSADLEIYHDGNNSYIQDSGTGSLKILAQDFDLTNAAESASMIRAIDGAQVELYYGGSKKLETKSTGINIQGVTEYADNTAAIAGGLTTGDVYRTGDLLKIVH
jgi:hypothetical protein